MSLLPQQILPQDVPIGELKEDGTVVIDHNWWLLLYNLCQQVLGNTQAGVTSSALTELAALDSDVSDSDAIALRRPISNLEIRAQDEITSLLNPDIARAILLAQDPLLPDPKPRAQPSAAITPSGSPFTYTAPFSGVVAVTGGTVSAIAIVRQGVSIATGVTVGAFPLAQGDGLTVTYSGPPTMTFLPSGGLP